MKLFDKLGKLGKKLRRNKKKGAELPEADLSEMELSEMELSRTGFSSEELNTEKEKQELNIRGIASELKTILMGQYLYLEGKKRHDERAFFIQKLNDICKRESDVDQVQVEDVLSVQNDDSLMRLIKSLKNYEIGSEEQHTHFKYGDLQNRVRDYQEKRYQKAQAEIDKLEFSEVAKNANWYVGNNIRNILSDKDRLLAFKTLLNISESFPDRQDVYYRIEYDSREKQYSLLITQKEDEESNKKSKRQGFPIEKIKLDSEGVKVLAIKGEISADAQDCYSAVSRKFDAETNKKIAELDKKVYQTRLGL